MYPSRVGDQLELALDDVRLQRRVAPWGGRSPRELTRAHRRFTLKAQAAKSMGDVFRDVAQLALFELVEGPPLYRGAPLLFELLELRGSDHA